MPEAWLVAVKDSGPLSDFDRLTLHQAVTIVALELLRGRVAGDTERRLAGDVLAAIVSGELSGSELARRLEPFGLAEQVAAIVVQRAANGRGSSVAEEDALAVALREEAAPGLVASAGALTCALVPGMPEEEQSALAGRLAQRVCARASAPASASASGAPVPAGRPAAASTRRAARLRRWPGGDRCGSTNGSRQRRRRGPGGHLQGPRVLPAAAVAAG